MATSVTQSLFGMNPQAIQAQRAAELEKQAMSFARLSPMESARQGLFYGVNQLGNALGQAMGYEDPEIAQARQVQGLLGGVDMSDPVALREAARNAPDPRVRAALADRASELEKTQADIGRLNALATGGGRTGGVGTGPERMAKFIADVDARIAAGQPVSDVDIRTADNFRTVLSSVKTYEMPDGSILRVAVKDFSAQQRAEAQGGIEVPTGVAPQAPQTGQPQPRPAPQATGGAQVIETPASMAARKKEQQGIQNQIDTISADLENINEALQLVSPRSAGIAGVLGIVPQTDARRVQKLIEGIDAAKVFNELTKLREASASGASGLGQVTEREISLLQNRLRVLDPFGSPEKLKADLQYIANAWTSIQDRLKESQTPTGQPTERPQEQPKANNQDEALIQRWMAANPGKSREQIVQGLKRRGLIK